MMGITAEEKNQKKHKEHHDKSKTAQWEQETRKNKCLKIISTWIQQD